MMKLGAQLFSIRSMIQTEEDAEATFRNIAEIGYDCVQLSGGGAIPAEALHRLSEENRLPIVLTHTDYDRILSDTDAVIAEHKLMGCPVVGCGSMPKEFRRSIRGFLEFRNRLQDPVQKILDAGLHFGYHNHDFELSPPEDAPDSPCVLEHILAECPRWDLIFDTCWCRFAGADPVSYLERIGGSRLANVHFKDMRKERILREGKKPKPCFVPCGDGIMDFSALSEVCSALGVQNVLVEQDNADEMEDPMSEMKKSYRYMRTLIPISKS